MSRSQQTEIKDEAQRWLVLRHSGHWSHTDEQRLQTWLSQSPAHRASYNEVLQLWTTLALIEPQAQADLALARSYPPPRSVRRRAYRLFGATVGVASLGLMIIWGLAERWMNVETYHTATGERQSLTLEDGSLIELNSRTTLTVSYTETIRRIRIEEGEAYFTVQHDPQRPFEVVTREAQIRDLGTQFDVLQQESEATVAVVEGKVMVASSTASPSQEITAGQRLAFRHGETSPHRLQYDRERLTAWREGRLVFHSVPLKEMLAEIARYHDVTMQLTDSQLENLSVSGTFDTHDLALLLHAVEATLPVKINRQHDRRIVISPRHPAR